MFCGIAYVWGGFFGLGGFEGEVLCGLGWFEEVCFFCIYEDFEGLVGCWPGVGFEGGGEVVAGCGGEVEVGSRAEWLDGGD